MQKGSDMNQIPVRPASPDDRSDAIILSFGAKWADQIKRGAISWVIRKRVPLVTKPDFVYFHVNSPVSAILARGSVASIESVSAAFAAENHQHIEMTKSDILSYVGNSPTIGLFKFDRIEIAPKAATITDLTEVLEYFAPQSFSFVSREALPIINKACGF
jgi:predicted transcriptional regulator